VEVLADDVNGRPSDWYREGRTPLYIASTAATRL